jgi:hypothetical protein
VLVRGSPDDPGDGDRDDVLIVVANTVADLTQAAVDPRLR